jgi:release factor glutamine methyltransferase
MTIPEAGKNLSVELCKIYDHREAVNIVHLVIEKITGLTKTERLIHKQAALTEAQEIQLQSFTQQLMQHKPVQYVLQEAWFAGMKFYVDEHVLIPRPETEELIETILAGINPLADKNLSILDIGTGSGCIAIALKRNLPASTVYGLDISEEALNIAKKNAVANKVNVDFFQTDILNIDPLKSFPYFDIIVSNPPYIQQSEAGEMLSNVLKYEPHGALFVPDNDALVFYNSIADLALQYLKHEKGKLYFEINEIMREQITDLLKQKGFSEISFKKDLQGKDRMIWAVLNPHPPEGGDHGK